jgi:hypothetical protein
MKTMLLCAAIALTGCSAAKSAVGLLSPKAPNVTVVNNVSMPQPAAVQTQTVVVVEKEKPAKKSSRSFFEKVGIVTTSTLIGAGVGALVGDATDSDVGTTTFLGAGAGAFAGLAIAKD